MARRLVLDVDALVHARRPGLLPETQALIVALPDRAYIERSVYHRDAASSGLLPVLDGWRTAGLLRDPVDYRSLPDGDQRFRRLGEQARWKGLSRQDRATLVLAVTLGDSAVLTGERLLAQAVRQHHLAAVDLFDVVRVALREGRIVKTRAREICIQWDRDRSALGVRSTTQGTSTRSWRCARKDLRCRSDSAVSRQNPRLPVGLVPQLRELPRE